MAVLNRVHGATSKLLVGSSFERDRQMQVFADPVIAKQDVYDHYMAFAHDPALFVCSTQAPQDPVHIKNNCEGMWYWVPLETTITEQSRKLSGARAWM